ncbi:N-acetyl-gamma-glutamyl-phosphate reductase [Novosphingobium aromaticivorans DSM 12444]|uniref:N-acetyl-gamma-glutamyl-phosphate reductase n=1 Tax=Novosphingobium aromaticivorans (strain ATCC 700278 / DSM 12444 / CCUG 56034 / CIP 105152 / NBRC 16084 / F199) TaxID=279238 RepID=Q2G9B4_NOVAD|nr:N-acetyl-gamma-glutamyl-phosphate reductase [Novosphingobium aromaticivorans]ABD25559.1 N-acetyl-gamma-glutamyl-phosphate reductase [Novosphingobium aromaticivorans DSM 12444]SCX97180.1 N-acetyl-gamma-glutamyl-phosphate reductase [Novosphingobium aromaticivorans]
MTTSVFIDGAAGTTGLEIAERLSGRSEFALIALEDARRKDDAARAEAINDADVVILCLPDDAARDAVAMIRNDRTRVIDASTAHRVADGWTYGFPEIVGRETVAQAKRVSNPGCYPTGFLGLLAPLVHNGLLPAAWPYSCTGVSGYSGGGKALIARFEQDRDIAWRGYGLTFGHKHVPEMQRYAGLAIAPMFSPAVVPAHRGMVVEIPLPLGVMPGNVPAELLRAALTQFYAGSPIVTVAQELPADGEMLMRASMEPWDGLELHVMGSSDGEQARLVAVLDNLGKGASGAAVQTLNLMAGLDETAGLRL